MNLSVCLLTENRLFIRNHIKFLILNQDKLYVFRFSLKFTESPNKNLYEWIIEISFKIVSLYLPSPTFMNYPISNTGINTLQRRETFGRRINKIQLWTRVSSPSFPPYTLDFGVYTTDRT